MDIKQLRFLDALAQEKHFSRAAAACFVSQPTLSLRIRQLEDELGVPLIYRGNRFEGLTPEGERVLAWARRVISNYEGLYQDIDLIKGQLSGSLRLGVIPSALPYVAQLTSPFLDQHKNVSIVSLSRSAVEINHQLEDFSIDIGLTYLAKARQENTSHVELYQESYVALVPNEEFFPGRDTMTWREAATLPLCLLSSDMHNRWIIENTFEQLGCKVDPQVQSNSILTLYSHVRMGNWATIAPDIHVQLAGIPKGIRVLPLTDPHIINPIGLIWRDASPLSPMIQSFLDVATQNSSFDSDT